MLLKYQSYLLFILYLFTLNASSEEQFNSNNAQLCNIDNIEQHIEEKNIQRIDISINKYRKWVKNYLAFIKSDNEIIGKEFKKKFKAKINVFFDNGLDCDFLANVRISGDLRDHVESDEKSVRSTKQKDKNINDIKLQDMPLLLSKQWGRRLVRRTLDQTGIDRTSFIDNIPPPITSLDIELLNGNINSVTKFKLFLPGTRNLDNEIFVATFLRHLGFISPNTFYVDSTFNDIEYQFIFQENPSKELLEQYQLREAVILKGNEAHAWRNNTFNPRFILAKVANPKWVGKGLESLKIAKKALSDMNRVYLKNINIATNKVDGYIDLDVNILSNGNPTSIRLNQEYMALMYAVHGLHALVINNRRFYYDPIYDYFIPIYYDGNANILHQKLRENYKNKIYFNQILLPDGSGVFAKRQPVTKNEIIGARSALFSIDTLDIQKLHKDLNISGLEITEDTLISIIAIIKFNLKRVSLLNASDINQKHQQNFTDFIEPSIELVFDTDELLEPIVCDFQLDSCYMITLDLDDYVDLLAGKLKNQQGEYYMYIGDSMENYKTGGSFNINERKKFTIEDGFEVELFGSINIQIDKNKRILYLKQESPSSRALITNGQVNNWNIVFNGVPKGDMNILDTNQRFNENLLTGCLTIIDTQLKKVSISIENSQCEDALNLFRVNGNIKNIKIYNSLYDALDLDYSNLIIDNIDIKKAGNDCIDLSSGDSIFSDVDLSGCGDKGISLGEESRSTFNVVNITNSKIGVAVKDSSQSVIDTIKIINTPICASAYNKKQEFWGGLLTILNYECDSRTISQQSGSLIKVNHEF